MKIQIISGFRQTDKIFLALEENYLKRLKKPFNIEICEYALKSKDSSEETKKSQSEILLSKVPKNSFLVVMDEQGENLTSRKFSAEVQRILNLGGIQNLTFLIGGPTGLDEKIKARANLLLSLSKLTLTADFARVLLIEQLYRAYSILNNLPYHKD